MTHQNIDIPYTSVHVKFCRRSAKSSSFNWFGEIFAKRIFWGIYGSFSPKISERKKIVRFRIIVIIEIQTFSE